MKDSTTDPKALTSAEQAQLVNSPGRLDKSFDGTQTIDLNTLVSERLTVSGSFDLRQERIDAFGKLLQALSIPTCADSSFPQSSICKQGIHEACSQDRNRQ